MYCILPHPEPLFQSSRVQAVMSYGHITAVTGGSYLSKVIFLAVAEAEAEGEGEKTSALEVKVEGEAEGLVFCI